MKKNQLLSTVATVLLSLWGGGVGLISLAFGWLIEMLTNKATDKDQTPYYEDRHSETIEQISRTYGAPDDIIVTDVTRANETDGAILVYKKAQFIVAAGIKVYFNEIVDVTFHNEQHVYATPLYAVVISTRLRNYQSIRLVVGQDVMWAGDVVAEIRKSITID